MKEQTKTWLLIIYWRQQNKCGSLYVKVARYTANVILILLRSWKLHAEIMKNSAQIFSQKIIRGSLMDEVTNGWSLGWPEITSNVPSHSILRVHDEINAQRPYISRLLKRKKNGAEDLRSDDESPFSFVLISVALKFKISLLSVSSGWTLNNSSRHQISCNVANFLVLLREQKFRSKSAPRLFILFREAF